MGQNQGSLGSRSKVIGVMISQTLKILAGGLTSTSSCFIFYFTFMRNNKSIWNGLAYGWHLALLAL